MPRKYNRKPSSRRTTKRYGKKYGRKRFKNKRFNNVSQLSMRATLAPRTLYVKLPWVQTFTPTVGTSGTQRIYFQGNGLVPYTTTGQNPANPNNNPGAGDIFPAGAVEYSQFYDKYFINGSSIKVEAVSTNSQALATSPLVRAVLLAVPFYRYAVGSTTDGDGWGEVRDQLNGYSYEQLLAYPFAKWRMLGTNTGGASRLVFKMFRKTKPLVGVKDIKDNKELSGELPDGSIVDNANTPAINPFTGFMYYLRFFNADATTTAPLQITVRMKLYATFTSREFNPTQTIISP